MNKFNVGDRVRVTKDLSTRCPLGALGTVAEVMDNFYYLTLFDGYRTKSIYHNHLELAGKAYPNPPHKHADLIKAWADGAEIECRIGTNWYAAPCPNWDISCDYRIKPVPSPEEAALAKLEEEAAAIAMKIAALKEKL
jgi:hypothetical protein